MALNLLKKTPVASPLQALNTLDFFSPYLPELTDPAQLTKLKALYRTLGNSNFLNRWVKRCPEQAASILKSDLEKTWTRSDFLQSFQERFDAADLFKQLIQFKYEHFFRITLRDIGLQKPFIDIAPEVSDLAQATIEISEENIRKKLELEYGFPCHPLSEQKIPFGILGMGKLGGRELNYSSDIDLIYYYESDESHWSSVATEKKISSHQYFTKLSEQLTHFLSQKSPEGFLYRVDLELRPEGKEGALANSLNALEHYYENFGATWEKQALIKAREMTSSAVLFEKLIHRLQPFIYSKTTDFSFLSRLLEMKEKVEASIRFSSEEGFHVKLGAGGIREIEFFVQSFQVLFGGKIPELQEKNTLIAIERLVEKKLLKRLEAKKLKSAYLFLRTLENRLQQFEERQTHRLPENVEERIKVARAMAYGGVSEQALEQFEKDLKVHTDNVQSSFKRLLKNNSPS